MAYHLIKDNLYLRTNRIFALYFCEILLFEFQARPGKISSASLRISKLVLHKYQGHFKAINRRDILCPS
jgi:hypothetical protein